MRPQTRVEDEENSNGPGFRLYCSNAASRIAAVAEVGRPRVRSGTNTPATAALLAASGPATPSIAPLPNSSGLFDRRFSRKYDRKVGISVPPAGKAPKGKPRAVPRSHGFQERRHSSAVMKIEPRMG